MYTKELYKELKPDIDKIVGFLFDFAQQQIIKKGNFLPFGALLKGGGEVVPFMGSTDKEITNSVEVLPVLYEGLKRQAQEVKVLGAAVCENVKITLENKKPMDVIKVTLQHRKGLVVAFYSNYRRKLLGGWEFGQIFVNSIEPEVKIWDN